jgi:hypothetical protein
MTRCSISPHNHHTSWDICPSNTAHIQFLQRRNKGSVFTPTGAHQPSSHQVRSVFPLKCIFTRHCQAQGPCWMVDGQNLPSSVGIFVDEPWEQQCWCWTTLKHLKVANMEPWILLQGNWIGKVLMGQRPQSLWWLCVEMRCLFSPLFHGFY